jgi:hypothetical protein
MIGFRNTLVHDYIEINRGIVFEVLHNGLSDLEELKRLSASSLYQAGYRLRLPLPDCHHPPQESAPAESTGIVFQH